MASLNNTFSDYYTKVSEFLGLGSSPTGTDLTKVKDIVYRGYKRYLYPTIMMPRTGKRKRHVWSWLKQDVTLITSDGKWKYALPDDFDRIIEHPNFSSDDGYPQLKKKSREYIMRMRNWTDHTSWPECYSIVASAYDKEIGTTWEMWLYPTPGQAYTLNFTYVISPPKPEDDDDIMIGGIESEEALMEMCLAVAEQQEEDGTSTVHTQLANELLQDLIAGDIIDSADSVGRMLDPRMKDSRYDMERDALTELDDDNIY